MKKALSVFLLAVLLLGFLPAFAPPARMITYAQVSVNRNSAFVGDAATWTVSNEVGGIDLLYYHTVYRNTTNVYQSGYTGSRSVSYKFYSPGTYKAFIYINDIITTTSITVHGPDVSVVLRPAPKISKVEALGGTSLKITWSKVTGASGYYLERSTEQASGYALIKSTTATSFTDGSLKAGTRYYYRVRAYNTIGASDAISSNYSAVAAGVPLAKSAIVSAAGVSTSQVKLVWKKVTGATGYQVLMSATAGGTFKAIKTTTALTFTASGLKHAKTYYFKVRPYKAFGTVKYIGLLSAYKAGRTK